MDFKKTLDEAGIPTTETELKKQWNAINQAQGELIKNDSKWSPFWRLISAIVTQPALWLMNLLTTDILPNSYIKTASGRYLDLLACPLKITRKPATKTQGCVIFERDGVTDQVQIPAGTAIQTPPINGQVYTLFTEADACFDASEKTLAVHAVAEHAGSAYNLAPGYFSLLPHPSEHIVRVYTAENWIITQGADAEDDESLRLRCQNQFMAVGQFHHDAAYRAIIAEFSGICTDYIWFEHGAPRGPGSANIYIMVDSGIPDKHLIDTLNQHINDNGYHGHGDDIRVFPIAGQVFNLGAKIFLSDQLSDTHQAQLQQQISDCIRCAFRQNTNFNVTQSMPDRRFSFSRLGEELHHYFPDLVSVEFDSFDISNGLSLPVLEQLNLVTESVPRVSL